MLEYVAKRLLWFIPTLFVITLIGFTLLVNSPGDPLDLLVSSLNSRQGTNGNDLEQQKTHWRKQLGLDLPLFYISISQLSEPDTLYKLYDQQALKTYKALLNQTGNAQAINAFRDALYKSKQLFNRELQVVKKDSAQALRYMESSHVILANLNVLTLQTNPEKNQVSIQTILSHSSNYSSPFIEQIKLLQTAFQTLKNNHTVYKNYIPKLIWHGTANRYHRWLFGSSYSKGVIRGDFGISYIKKEPVMAIIKHKIIWSLFFSVLSIILAYAISIPIGIAMARRPHSKGSKLTELLLFMMYSLPSFFVGVLLLMLFANPDVISIFPPSGIKPIEGYPDGASLLGKFLESLPYMILPLVCYTYSSLAFISRLTQTAVSQQLSLDYIKTAKAKGLSNHAIIWKHAFKNSLLPLITVFSSIFPAIIGGSVIIESIFTIPGMGLETVRAIIAKDYPIVIAVITLSSLLTMLSYLIADVLYAWVDPRIRYKK